MTLIAQDLHVCAGVDGLAVLDANYERRPSSSPRRGMSGGPSNMRYTAIANEKSTVSQSKKSIAFTPNQADGIHDPAAQLCVAHALTGSHPSGFRCSVDRI